MEVMSLSCWGQFRISHDPCRHPTTTISIPNQATSRPGYCGILARTIFINAVINSYNWPYDIADNVIIKRFASQYNEAVQ